MDLDKILHFVPTHIEQIIAVLGALFLVTTILLLVRSLKERPEESNGGVDVRTIEGALKRVLAQTPPVVEKTVSAEGSQVIADLAPLKNALAEKEKQLAALNAELTEAKAAAASAAAAGTGGGAEAAGSSTAVAALEMEIGDLKARLAEYEIIEDDIADLALYKEENARLKKEIEEARTGGGAGQTQAAAPAAAPFVEADPALGIPGLSEALQEEAAAAAKAPAQPPVQQAAPQPEEEMDPLAELLANAPEISVGEEEVPEGLLADTSAVDNDPLANLDTDKMLAEAESLAGSTNTADVEINALSDLLDTDKLLEEVNTLDAQDVMSEFKDKSKLG